MVENEIVSTGMGTPPQLPSSPTSITDGSKDVATAGTRVTLVAAATPARYVIITAKQGNTGYIWVGGATVANGSGSPLKKRESITLAIDDLQKVYLDATVNGDGVTYTALY